MVIKMFGPRCVSPADRNILSPRSQPCLSDTAQPTLRSAQPTSCSPAPGALSACLVVWRGGHLQSQTSGACALAFLCGHPVHLRPVSPVMAAWSLSQSFRGTNSNINSRQNNIYVIVLIFPSRVRRTAYFTGISLFLPNENTPSTQQIKAHSL